MLIDEQARMQKRSIESPEEFWGDQANDLVWFKPWEKVLDRSRAPHFYSWYSGGECNTCFNALDRHIGNGQGETLAIIYDSPMTGQKQSFTYLQLRDRVERLAGALEDRGVVKGDRVLIYMPMVPEAVIGMLACARLGAIHSVVFGGFAANELATRIKDARPKLILTASCGIEPGRVIAYQNLVEEALVLAPRIVQSLIILARPQAEWKLAPVRDSDWLEAEIQAKPRGCVAVAATDPLYILYTSGTTGQPKGVVRDNGGHMVALLWSMRNIYNIRPGEVFWAASDVGWVVGHSYIVYAPLLLGATTVIYEGKPVGTPDAGAFWRMISEYKISTLFTAPTAFRAIKKEDPQGLLIKSYDLQHFRALFLAGERCDPDTLQWAQEKLKVPVIDHWWQTETGWAIAANCIGLRELPVKPGSPTRAVPGYQIEILDELNSSVVPGKMGDICLRLPLPPGCFIGLWEAEKRFISSYLEAHPGYYTTGDAGYLDDDEYVFVMSRIDDIINVAGHRLSTGAMEEVLASLPQVAECAVIGVQDQMKGQLPLGFMVLKSGINDSEADVIKAAVSAVRDKIGPVAAFKLAVVVKRLPKTRSGKILRGTMAKIADGETVKTPATIDDPAILDEIRASLKTIGYAKQS